MAVVGCSACFVDDKTGEPLIRVCRRRILLNVKNEDVHRRRKEFALRLARLFAVGDGIYFTGSPQLASYFIYIRGENNLAGD